MLINCRFNLVDPTATPEAWSARYRAMLEMASYVDANGFSGITLEEHHGAENGWSPTPLLNAAMILARTENLMVTVSALLLPLHDPIRVAEDIAVLDLCHPGRLVTIFGLGYRPSEYQLLGKDWDGRGRLMDESLATVLTAWTGEPFSHRGDTARVTPVPITRPHPLVLVGGTSKAAARRAARFGLPMFPAAHLPELEAYYHEQCREHGTTGFSMMPSPDTAMTFISRDPDATWAEHGQHFLHEASVYASWQTSDIHSAVRSEATTVEELREEGIYQVSTPDECVALIEAAGAGAVLNHHPLCGGMPVDEGWTSLRLFVDEVMPRLP